MHADTIGVMELFLTGEGGDMRMKFAYELVAIAMTKNKDTAQPEKAFLEEAFTFLRDAFIHAHRASQIALGRLVYTRFGS